MEAFAGTKPLLIEQDIHATAYLPDVAFDPANEADLGLPARPAGAHRAERGLSATSQHDAQEGVLTTGPLKLMTLGWRPEAAGRSPAWPGARRPCRGPPRACGGLPGREAPARVPRTRPRVGTVVAVLPFPSAGRPGRRPAERVRRLTSGDGRGLVLGDEMAQFVLKQNTRGPRRRRRPLRGRPPAASRGRSARRSPPSRPRPVPRRGLRRGGRAPLRGTASSRHRSSTRRPCRARATRRRACRTSRGAPPGPASSTSALSDSFPCMTTSSLRCGDCPISEPAGEDAAILPLTGQEERPHPNVSVRVRACHNMTLIG